VTHVVRLNEPKYDRQKFIKAGINHSELYFIDGSTPSDVKKSQIKSKYIGYIELIHETK
jgi:hypothetical protein